MIILGITASSDRNAPDAPTIGTATNVGTGRAFNNGRADVTFTAPTYTGGSDIVSYTVTSSPGGFTGTGSASPISVTGLQSGVAYTFTVTATNAAGFTSPASAASNSITATTVPQAPTIGTATAGDASASVTFTANATGGSAITSFTATSSPGSITGTAASSPITVSGLTNGTAYTFTVTATNANGTSAASAASNSVTPAASGSYDSIASFTPTSGTNVTFSNIPQTYKNLIVRMVIRSDTSGWSGRFRYNTNNNNGYQINGMFSAAGNGTVNSFTQNSLNGIPLTPWWINTGPSRDHFIELTFPNYRSSTYNKMCFWRMGTIGGINSNEGEIQVGSGLYITNSEPITVLSYILTTGQYESGTTISLYGTKDS